MKKIFSVLIVIVLGLALLPVVNNYTTDVEDIYKVASYNTPYNNDTVGFLGDSITYGVGTTSNFYRYTDVLDRELDWSIFNYGLNGSEIASSGTGNSFVERYTLMDPALDTVFIFGGVNDWLNGDAAFGTNVSTDPTTFYGALDTLFDGIKTAYPTSRVYVITPFRATYNGTDYTDNNATTGLPLESYVDAIEEKAYEYLFNVLNLFDLWTLDFTSYYTRERYSIDGLHLNDFGNQFLANTIKDYLLNNIINYNTITPEAFITYTGGIVTPLSGQPIGYSDYIPVTAGEEYEMYNVSFADPNGANSHTAIFYDGTQTFISGVGGSNPQIFTIPAGAEFMRVNVSLNALEDYYLFTDGYITYTFPEQDATLNLVRLTPLIFVIIIVSAVIVYVKIKES